jgi:hypothetical protein
MTDPGVVILGIPIPFTSAAFLTVVPRDPFRPVREGAHRPSSDPGQHPAKFAVALAEVCPYDDDGDLRQRRRGVEHNTAARMRGSGEASR